jgi:putative Mn2+ efflux pump MntP
MLDGDHYYVGINIGIGAGIAADAMLATIARARTLHSFRDAMKWASAIGLTHWLFPMVGFLGGWFLASHGVARALVYGLGGAVLMGYVLHVLRERSGVVDGEAAKAVQFSFWLAVWGVSVDALITGPGKAAATAHWTKPQVMLSFPFVGIVVFVLVLLSTVPAMMLHERIKKARTGSWRPLSWFFFAATWVEVLVFTWFATLSLTEAGGALQWITPTYALASGCAAVLGIIMMATVGLKVWRAQCASARKVLQA